MRRHADATNFVNGLRLSLSGSRVPGGKIEGLGQSITATTDAGVHWRELLMDLEKLAEFDVERDGADRRPETPMLSAAGLSANDLDRVARSLKPEDWLTLSLTPIKSVPVFEYRAREADYLPFSSASSGDLTRSHDLQGKRTPS
jgi:hypothetical protein